jgi:hypothetical protein
MKYFKFAQISAKTGISWAIEQPLSGPSYPDILGLEVSNSIQLSDEPLYYIAEVSDEAQPNPENHIFEIDASECASIIKTIILPVLEERKNSIYQEELTFRDKIFTKYHETATAAGIYKYDEAKALLEDPNADAPDIVAEANARGIDPIVLAERVIKNHEEFREIEAKIAGIRGKILDRIENFVFDEEHPFESYYDFLSTEILGVKNNEDFGFNGKPKTINVVVNKYELALEKRYEFLGNN